MKRSRIALPKDEYKKLCDEVDARDKHRCIVCRRRNDLHRHHIIFRSAGGDDASWNLVTVCMDCHGAIHDRYVIILPLIEGQDINADDGVKLMFVNGWTPKQKGRRTHG